MEEMRFRGGMEPLSEIGIFTYDLILDLLWGDARTACIMGFSKEEMNEGIALQDYIDRVHPEDLPEFARTKHYAIANALSFESSHRLLREDMQPVWVTVHSRPCRVHNGLPTLISGVILLGRNDLLN